MDDSEFSAIAMAAEAFRSIYAVVFWLGSIFLRDDAQNLWKRYDDATIRSYICRMIDGAAGGPAAHPRFVGDVLQAVKDRSLVEDDGRQPPFYLDGRPYINLAVVRNGILNTRTRTLSPHDRMLFNLSVCDFDYDPTATCPTIIDFLEWFCCGDEELIELNLEIDAYCAVLTEMQAQRYIIFYGDGANGKLPRLELMSALAGNNVATVPLEMFGNRFAVSSLIGKAINIDADVNDTSKVAEGRLKQFCDGSRVWLEEKFKTGSFTILHTRFVFATNKMIRLFGQTEGDWRRPLIVRCNATVTNRILSYEQRLLGEMSGYFNMVLDAADRLGDRGDFLVPDSCQVLLNEFRDEFDSARDYCKRCVTHHEGSFAQSQEMLRAYNRWCSLSNRKPVSDWNFWRSFHRVWKETIEAHKVYATKQTIEDEEEWYVTGRKRIKRKTLNVRGWMNLRFTDSSYVDEEPPASITVTTTPAAAALATPLAIAAPALSPQRQESKDTPMADDEVNRFLDELGA